MNYKMNKLQKWILRLIFKDIIVQSHEHKNNLIRTFQILYEEMDIQFSEDTYFSHEEFLKECLHEANPYHSLSKV